MHTNNKAVQQCFLCSGKPLAYCPFLPTSEDMLSAVQTLTGNSTFPYYLCERCLYDPDSTRNAERKIRLLAREKVNSVSSH